MAPEPPSNVESPPGLGGRGACDVPKLGRLLLRSLLLTTPVVVLYASQYLLHPPGTIYTGFIQFDMPTYVANAREYVEHPGSLLYSNPYDWRLDSPRIYFQPLIWLVGQLLRLGLDPAVALAAVGFAATIVAMALLQVLLKTYRRPESAADGDKILVLAAWGGGLFTVTYLLTGFDLDPGYGFWFLNLGRNFVYPTEAFYHVVTLLIFLSVLTRRFWLTLLLGLLIVLSHPFTGLQYAAAIATWAVLERFLRPQSIGRAQAAILLAPVAVVILYYLVFLPSYSSHAALMDRWHFEWTMSWTTIAVGYGPVACLALHRCVSRPETVGTFELFLICVAILSFGLAKHDILLEPLQPLHFTRGHIWFPLFLLGLPSLAALIRHWREKYRPRVYRRIIIIVMFLALFDNIAFFANRSSIETGIFITNEDHDLIEYLSDRDDSPVVITADPMSSYLLPVYSSARPFVGHWGNTPYFTSKGEEAAELFDHGDFPTGLGDDCVVVAVAAADEVPILPGDDWTATKLEHWRLRERPGDGC